MAAGAQIRLADLPGVLEALRQVGQPFKQSQVTFEQQRDDEALLMEIQGNRMLAEGFVNSRGLLQSWNLTEIVLRAYVEPIKWKGSTDQYRSALGVPILAENFYSLHSALHQTLFAGNRPFIIDPGASTKIEVASALEAIIMAQLKVAGPKGTSAKQEIRAMCFDGGLYGTGVLMVGYETRKVTKVVRKYKHQSTSIPIDNQGAIATVHHNEEIEEQTTVTEVRHPVVEHVPLRRVRVAPDCRRSDIRSASWRGRIIYLDSYQLKQFRDVDCFDIPTDEELVKLTTPYKQDPTQQNVLETQTGGVSNQSPIRPPYAGLIKAQPESLTETNTVDPLAKKFEVFEYITDQRIGWVLEGQKVIRNSPNDGDVIMLSFNFREAPDSFYGYGQGMFCTDFQRMAQGITNVFFDNLAIELQGTFTKEQGINVTAQPLWMYPGAVAPKGTERMERNSVDMGMLATVDMLKRWSSNITGAGMSIQGQNPGHPGDVRTKQGVEALTGGDATKMQDLVDQVCELVFIPLLEFFIEQIRKMKPSEIRAMLTEQLTKAVTADPLDIMNGYYKVTISAGAKLAARQALNNSLGYIQSILQQPGLTDQLALAGIKFDWAAVIRGVMESFGSPYTEQWIVPMTDEDKQRLAAQQQSPSAKLQADLAKIQAAGQVKTGVDNNQAENRAILELQKKAYEMHSDAAFGGNG